MFGAKYSRLKFWLMYLITAIPFLAVIGFLNAAEQRHYGGMEGLEPFVGYAIVAKLLLFVFLMNYLANRIRAYGSNPHLAWLSLFPLVGTFQAFYYGFKKSKE